MPSDQPKDKCEAAEAPFQPLRVFIGALRGEVAELLAMRDADALLLQQAGAEIERLKANMRVPVVQGCSNSTDSQSGS